MSRERMQIALGPIPYFWTREEVFAFYEQAARWPVDVVYLGEVVCAKRRAVKPEDWLDIGARLASAGKEVVLSTLALVEARSDLAALRRYMADGRFVIEANDFSAVSELAGRPFVAGLHLNVYNARTAAVLARAGAIRFAAPVEYGRDALSALVAHPRPDLAIETLVFGRLPLALSARCFTARSRDLTKDACGFCCQDYPSGLPLATQDGTPFLAVNGIQLQSWGVTNLVDQMDVLAELGVSVARVSPLPEVTGDVVSVVREVLDGRLAASAARARLDALVALPITNGYWHGEPGMTMVVGYGGGPIARGLD